MCWWALSTSPLGADCGLRRRRRRAGGARVAVWIVPNIEHYRIDMGPGTPDMLKPGAKILIFGAVKGADGGLTTQGVVVGKDGLVPPM